MLVPNYKAYVKRFISQPISEWYSPIAYTYDRQHIVNEAAVDYFFLGYHTAPAYTQAKHWYPKMPQAADIGPEVVGYQNTGSPNGGYTTWEEALPEHMAYIDGHWTIQRLLELQIPIWEEHRLQHEAFIEALIAVFLDDNWITEFKHVNYSHFTQDAALAEYYKETKVITGATFLEPPTTIVQEIGFPPVTKKAAKIKASVTPCLQKYTLEAFYNTWDLVRINECFLVETSANFPELWVTPVETLGFQWHSEPAGSPPPEYPSLYDSVFYEDVNPWRYTQPNLIMTADHFAGQDAAILAFIAGEEATYGANFRWSILGPVVSPVSASWTCDALDALGISQRNAKLSNWASYFVARNETEPAIGTRYLLEYDDGTDTWATQNVMSSYANQRTKMIKPWDHLDPDFVGYVPYHGHMWFYHYDDVIAYAQNPDNRFDGHYFGYMVKIATVMRDWFPLIEWQKKAGTQFELPSFLPCVLQSTGLLDTETGIVTNKGTCYHLSPVEFNLSDYITPDFVNVDIENYAWSDYSFTIPGGSFFLEQGSSAPLYPTFYGAYVYDLHLQKWGKMVEPYKRLIDYQALNTYLPGEPSYERFGIYGGIVDAAGKIKLFDESPEVSEIVYGKIGYYRQGMTTVEEIRAHHRIPVSGKIHVNSSLDGKEVAWTLSNIQEFTDSNLWHMTGGYSGRWHSLKFSGRFDLSYLEFRGIIQGKR